MALACSRQGTVSLVARRSTGFIPRRFGASPRGRKGGGIRVDRMSGGEAKHTIDAEGLPYAPEKLERKNDVSWKDFSGVDLRAGRILRVEEFPQMRKPSYKLEVDFGPVVGKLWTSAQVTNYSIDELVGRMVVGTINLGKKKLPTGFISEFLVMGALNPDGTVKLLQLPGDTLEGSCVM